jgi:putative glutathione S-transferase
MDDCLLALGTGNSTSIDAWSSYRAAQVDGKIHILQSAGSRGSMGRMSETATGQGVYVNPTGEFTRDQRYIATRITRDGRDGYPVEPGRYRLVVSRACPWASRAVIVRRLLGLEDAISMAIAGPTHDERSWTFDLDPGGRDPVLGMERLQEAFFRRFPGYERGITVPAIVDVPTGQVVTNDYPQITIDMSLEWTDYQRPGAPQLYPEALRAEIDEVNDGVFRDVNNGVYRAGFAGTQEAYEKAYNRLFDRLDLLSERLAGQRYLVGDTITEADVRLFTTLVRFDAVYHGHFKCNRQKLSEQPVLWAYARDLFQTPGFGDTIDFVHIKRHYYEVHRDINPTGIVPAGPDLANWMEAHGREALGGRPFGEGTPPGPPPPAEVVPAGHTPLGQTSPAA